MSATSPGSLPPAALPPPCGAASPGSLPPAALPPPCGATLDPFTLPLHGTRLIEAGAGTGKTHAIASLYLRLLLEGELDVDRILVVTFTNAATSELRDRIRRRIARLLAHLETAPNNPEAEPELERFAERVSDSELACQRLRDTLVRLDEAAIFTIHGFCQRVLVENALESGTLFESDFTGGDLALERQVVEDFWRHQSRAWSPALAGWVRAHWSSGPPDLLRSLSPLLHRPEASLCLDESADQEFLVQTATDAFESLRSIWATQGTEAVELLLAAEGLSKNKDSGYTPENIAAAQRDLGVWFQEGVALCPPLKPLELFSREAIAQSKGRGAKRPPPEHPFFDHCQAFLERIEATRRRLLALFLQQARDWCLHAIATRKEQRRELTFDDLLERLDAALAGPGGEELAGRLRERYPAALIDEFQDTDPMQYRIFRRIYGNLGTLFMIGDPKQAIYSFRGADIFTYIAAKRETAPDHRYTLTRNWRSAERLVTAVNRLFGHSTNPFLFEEIPFEPLTAAGQADKAPLTFDGQCEPPLRLWFIPRLSKERLVAKGRADPAIATACACEIARLIRLGEAGRAKIGDRPLGPGDIALLVRNRYEAEELGAALRRLGIGSVFQHRESVFATDEAQELARLLRALATPNDGRALRAAAATSLLGADGTELQRLSETTDAWDHWHGAFAGHHHRWREQGFMAMFLRLLHEQGIPARLLQGERGERRLTNLLHLAELLQNASRQQETPERLLRWFADQRTQAGQNDSEEQTLFLESDQRLVRIVTIHKSKGLQYPVVFLPFLYRGKSVAGQPPLAFHQAQTGEPCFDLGSSAFESHLGLAEQERLAEDARLAYVALTRAEHRCYLPWGAIHGHGDGILSRLLHPQGIGDDDALRAELNAMAGNDGAIAIESLPEPSDCPPLAADSDGRHGLAARPFTGTIERGWRLASYSGLTAGEPVSAGTTPPAAERLSEGGGDIEPSSEVVDFPAGILPGLFLHSLLERLDFPQARGEALRCEVERQLDLYGLERRWTEAAEQLVANLLDTPLDTAGTLCLRQITTTHRRVEMAFHYPLARLSAADLNDLIDGLGQAVPLGERLRFNPVEGLMTGFIDLVFEHQGRYFLADYKSNRLDDYGTTGLAAAMGAHRYDLQYLIYTVALHRYLGQRLPGYDYDIHFGGVYYLFPRGMAPDRGRQGVFFDRPRFELIDALDRRFRGEP